MNYIVGPVRRWEDALAPPPSGQTQQWHIGSDELRPINISFLDVVYGLLYHANMER